MIKNVIFDLGSTILRNRSYSILDNFDMDTKTYNELSKFFLDFGDLDLGKETLEEKYEKCNFSKDIEEKYKDILIHYYKYRKINPDLIDIISKLKKNNYKIYILSDISKECYEYYKNNETFKNVDIWVVSSLHNAIKEDGALFDIMINKYNLNPKECYFIDNSIINIEEAKKRGIKGFLFDESKDIKYLYNDMKNSEIDIL